MHARFNLGLCRKGNPSAQLIRDSLDHQADLAEQIELLVLLNRRAPLPFVIEHAASIQ